MKVFYRYFLLLFCWLASLIGVHAQSTTFSAKINFQDQASTPPVDYLVDYGLAYQLQTNGESYGWLSVASGNPINLTSPDDGVGRNRNISGVSALQNTLVYMQGNDIAAWTGNRATEAYWEIAVPNGSYKVTLSVGDPMAEPNASEVPIHHINVEGAIAINEFTVDNSLPEGDPSRFRTASVTVEVTDGKLTIDPVSTNARNTKINSVEILPATSGGEESLEFSDASLSVSIPEGGSSKEASNFISATNFVPSPIDISLSASEGGSVPSWLKVNGQLLNGSPTHNTAEAEIVFEFDPSGLSEGTYQATVTASGPNATTASFTANLEVSAAFVQSFPVQVNFQDEGSATPATWVKDFGEAYGLRTSGYTYGWVSADGSHTPLSLVGNGRNRNRSGFTLQENTLMHMQYNHVGGSSGVSQEGVWEIAVPNGDYEVTITAGDLSNENLSGTKHHINVEGKNVLSYDAQIGQINLQSRMDIIKVNDGKLTLDASGGYNSKIMSVVIDESANSTQPQVLGINIEDGATDVELLPTISSLNLYLPNAGVEPATLNNSNVRLYQIVNDPEIAGGETEVNVLSTIGTSGGFDVISLTPNDPLEPNSQYKFEVTANLTDQTDVPFIPFVSYFTTGDGSSSYTGPIEFVNSTTVASGGNGYTSLEIGPDEKLYGVTSDGFIRRWEIDRTTGLLKNGELITTIRDAEGGDRLVIGMDFAPDATAENPELWISHTKYGFSDQPDFQGKISKLDGAALQNITDYVIHLPRSKKDHVTNSIKFGPDGALYILQGSNSAMGAYDNAWRRHEMLLSGALLKLDIALADAGSLPIDAKTEEGGSYNPYAVNAPLSIYASGVRNAYDLEWHSNGQVYVPTNGSAGLANAPGSDPGSTDYREPQFQSYSGPVVPYVSGITTQNDFLFRVEEDGYYGHPNPRRAEYVLNAGNPGSTSDWPEAVVSEYPEGTQPDADYKGYSADLGKNKSPNGIIEYKSDAFNGALAGKLINVWYVPGKLVVMEPGNAPDYDIVNVIDNIPSLAGFNKPLDVVEDVVTGNLYVSEYQDFQGGNGKITLIKPAVPPSNVEPISELHINFQDESSATPSGYFKDFGEPYGVRSPVSQGGGQFTYGWLATDNSSPLDLSNPGNGRTRSTTSNTLQASFMHMQGNDIPNWTDGTPEEGIWGVALENGFYEVTVSVGDADETSSVHHINAEGVNLIDQFVPSGANGSAQRFATATASVHVTDGVLNLSAMEGGTNTKINSVSIVPLDSSLAPPSIQANLSGDHFQQNYLNQVDVSLTSSANATGASQVSISYTLYDGSGTSIKTGTANDSWTIDEPGEYTLVVNGTDDSPEANQSTVIRRFSVEFASGAMIGLENMNKIPGTTIGFPGDSVYAFQHTRDPFNFSDQESLIHNTNTMRIHNPGTSALTINGFSMSDETEFIINSIDGTAYASVSFPISIAPNDHIDVLLEFIEESGPKGSREQELTIHSNADNGANYKVVLVGNYMTNPESVYEVSVVEILKALGVKTSIGGDPTPSSDHPTAEDVNNGVHGDLILSSVFEVADPSQPVRAFQLAAYRGVGNATTELIEVNTDNRVSGNGGQTLAYAYGTRWHQSLFPKTNNNRSNTVIAGDAVSGISVPFRIQVADYRSSGGNPSGNLEDEVLGIRIYKVYNYDGELIPNHYIVLQDYVGNGCGGGSNNCDWNDNIQYFMNIKPVADPFVSTALQDMTAATAETFVYDATTAFDRGYAGNEFTYTARLTNGNPLPGWISIDENTGEVRGTVPVGAPASLDIQVTATDLNGIVVTDSELSSFRINIQEVPLAEDIWLEAECGIVGANWNVENDTNASGGSYATIRAGLNSYTAAPGSVEDYISHTFTVTDGGNYVAFGRVRAGNNSDNSFWMRLDNGSWQQFDISPLSGSFTWRELSMLSGSFAAGSTHTIDIAYREDGAAIDKLYLTANGTVPEGLGEAAPGCGGGSNALPVADAGTDITVTDSDGNNVESVTLDGSNSVDSDGSIVSYSWSDGSTEVATTAVATLDAPVGTTTYTLTVTDDQGAKASDGVVVTVNDASFGASDIWLEAECGIVGANWNVESSANASAGSYVTIRAGLNAQGGASNSVSDHLSYSFTVTEGGTYALYGRVIAPSSSDDSFWVRLDGGSWQLWGITPATGSFAWREVGVLNLNFTAGSIHTIDFAYREDGAAIDKLYLTANGTVPEGLGEAAPGCGGGSNALPVADAGADITVTDSDGNNVESVTLDGSNSVDSDGSIVSYSWSDGSTEVATTAVATLDAPVGTTTYTLTVTDDQGAKASDGVVVTVNDAGFGSSDIWLEAECGIVGTNWNVESSADASAGSYVTIRAGLNAQGGASNSVSDHLSYSFTVNEGGTYALYGRVIAPSSSDDSFWVRLDGGSWQLWGITPATGSFAWREVGVLNLNFTAGSIHTIDFAYREDGAAIDKLYLTANGTVPEGLGEAAPGCGGGSNALPVADAGADITVTDSDGNNVESVTLDGSNSVDSDGSIVSYSWSDGSTEVATTAVATLDAPVGTTTYTLTVTDDQGAKASDGVVVTVNDAGFGSSDIWLEAECGIVGTNWNVESSADASAGSYVTIKPGYNAHSGASSSANDHLSYTFTVSQAGEYGLYGRVIVPSSSDDSFWIRLDGGNWQLWGITPATGSFAWREVGVLNLNFTAGSTHTIDIAYREDGAILDKLYLTKDGQAPIGIGEDAGSCDTSARVNKPGIEDELSGEDEGEEGGACTGCAEIRVYPNPLVDSDLYIELINMKDLNSLEMRIVSASGQIVRQSKYLDVVNLDRLEIDLGEIGSGMYVVQIITRGKVYQKQFIKL
ncbi:PKD domain-containing protein [Porifericola rhodea]|uniref:PKD domain-containing protein n=1 Tax=Porifericola rhodea TaxID=930972 RepID=UPI002666C843|nr:PKD domain-containing protein [Porifericola rhodea]WKN32537.1 PKD domain-containing protein [Porifericola rhodea]